MKKKPVYLIVQHLSPGGIEVLSLNLLKELKNSRDIYIISLQGNEKDTIKSWPVLSKYKNRFLFLEKKEKISFSTFIKMLFIFLKKRPSAVHTHHIGPLIYGGIAARICGVKNLIHTEHDGWHLKENGRKETILNYILKPNIVAVSKNVSHALKENCNIQKEKILYNGIDTNIFSPMNKALARYNFRLPDNKKIIGSAGRLEEVKGHQYLIKAMIDIDENIHLAIAGDGSQKCKLVDLVQKLGIENRVHFLGRVDNMRLFYNALDVFCLPSLNEGFPLSPLEAQACGIPAVLTNVGGCSEALCRDTGFLAKSKDPQDLAITINKALDSKIKKSPRAFIVKNFSLKEMVEKYNSLYQNSGKQNNHAL